MAMTMKISKAATSALQARSSRATLKTQQRRTAVLVRAEEKKFNDQEWDQAIKKASGETGAAVPGVATPAPTPVPTTKAISFGDAMAFSGPAPETVNGRLAMLGFAAALGAELSTGESVVQQLSDAPAAILAVFVAFAIASLVPILKGANLKESLGPFTPAAELLNGRAAMLGIAAVLAVEFAKGSAFF